MGQYAMLIWLLCGIRTSIAKQPIAVVNFQGAGWSGLPVPHLDRHLVNLIKWVCARDCSTYTSASSEGQKPRCSYIQIRDVYEGSGQIVTR